ncbi:hypothetical protein [Paenibacillus alkalitolerans]|uniref:hypothetical protein n=1 Tax=Paenibacillus alkalitolerans TaxID=2799335 RepID=UPI0018F3E66A|nr:hypothetical protein [Paenibacillus alkalitolerans]
MRETREHIEAFDYYYSLGESRSLGKVAQNFGKADSTIKRWSSEFAWADRVQQRDHELGSEIIARTNEGILGFHEMNREIATKLVRDLLARVNAGKFKLNSIADWKRVAEIVQISGEPEEGEDGDNIRSLAAVLRQSAESILRQGSNQQNQWGMVSDESAHGRG